MGNQESDYTQALNQISKTANSSLPLKKTLNSIARSASKAMDAAGCSAMLLNPQRQHLEVVAAYGLSDLYLKKGALDTHRSLPEILEGKAVAIFDILKDRRAQYPEAAAMEKIRSVLGMPLAQKGEVVGEVRVYTQERRRFSSADKDFLSAVANITAMALEKADLYQTLKADHHRTVATREKMAETPALPSLSLRPSRFGHPSEEEFARLLDFYRIEWLYEPRSFPLAWKDDRVAEMFTPDFYLPELDLYIELTTLRQSLITEKNRKLRRLKALYPEVNIKLLNKKDYLRLLAKYGYGPLGATKVEGISRILFSHTQIQRRTRALAKTISRDYVGSQLVLIGILKGVVCFMSDLMQHISIPVALDFMAISYYGDGAQPPVKITKDLDISIAGHDVLMVEDIVDTGMTLNYVLNHLSSHNPRTLRVCTLLDKKARRLVDVPIEYTGFEIPDEFVVGYGLDYNSQYRNLPFIGVLTPEAIEEQKK